MIAIDLSKEQMLDADPKTIQQINFSANPDRAGNTTMFFIIEEAKQTILDFLQGTVKVLSFYSHYKKTQYNTLKVNLSNAQFNKLKSGIKNGAEVTLKLSSNVFGDSNDDNIFRKMIIN